MMETMSEDSKTKSLDLNRVLSGKRGEVPGHPSKDKPSEELEAVRKKLREAEEESKKNHDKLLRLMAEFENYKKRINKDHAERIKYSQEAIISELLLVLDDFDRVLEHLPEEETPGVKSLVEGVHLIHRHLMKALKKFALEEVKTDKKAFDPHLHEAIAQVISNEHAEGEIVSCHRKGYQLHGRLIRPASVTVAGVKKACLPEAKEMEMKEESGNDPDENL